MLYRAPVALRRLELQPHGGPKGDRTPDLRIANAALSQLSYRPMVGQDGLEPPTSRLSGVRSNQLSYCPSTVPGWGSNPRPPAEKTLQGGLGALPLSYPFLSFPSNSGGQSCATHLLVESHMEVGTVVHRGVEPRRSPYQREQLNRSVEDQSGDPRWGRWVGPYPDTGDRRSPVLLSNQRVPWPRELQGQQDLNPQPADLESAALPVAPYP